MEWNQVIIGAFKRSSDTLDKALANLSQDDLGKQPNPDSNSMGWISWHLSRIQDRAISRMAGQEQVWIKNGWHAKFGREANPEDTGLKHTSQDVAAFESPEVGDIIGYNRAVFERTEKFLNSLTGEGLDAKTGHPMFHTVGDWLSLVLTDVLQHSGQVAYLRGMLKGKGWSDS
jgi:hypothetical protein